MASPSPRQAGYPPGSNEIRLSQLVRPTLENNIAFLPASLAHLLGSQQERTMLPADWLGPGDDYESVALIFVDAFGWRFVRHYLENDPIPELQSMIGEGTLSPLSSQFPSTTAVHVTTLNSGLPIGESGVCEWHYYESRVDRVITPLPFLTPWDSRPDTLTRQRVSPEQFLPRGWFYPELMGLGWDCALLQRKEYDRSPYARALRGPARALGFGHHLEGLDQLGRLLSEARRKTYVYYYFEEFDSKMHHTGPLSTQSTAVIKEFFCEFDRRVVRPVRASGRKVLFVFTADHGMTSMNPKKTIYLERDLPESVDWLRSTASGQKIYPCGSSRDLFLHLKPECKDAAHRQLRAALSGLAQVLDVQELLREGSFGANPNPVLSDNLGDLLIAPYAGESVYWLGPNQMWKQNFLGHHGGLTSHEMETFLLAFSP